MTEPATLHSQHELTPGIVLHGKYRLDALIAEGGMGMIWRARQLDLERDVAIKVLRAELSENEEVVQRTINEARAVARLRGEHVVRILDSGVLESGAPYLVMEHLEGRDLARLLEEWPGPLPVTLIVDLLLDACAGLAEAHANGIIHRDFKPENLFLAEQPDGSVVVKIIDFGISKQLCSTDTALTSPSAAIGSPQYMSPEQMRGVRDIDARADVWSVGVTLYELLTGVAPFAADTVPTVCSRVLKEDPVPPHELRPDLPLELSAIIDACLKKDRNVRIASVSELSYALSPFGGAAAVAQAERIARVSSGLVKRASIPAEPATPRLAQQRAARMEPTRPRKRAAARARFWAPPALVALSLLNLGIGTHASSTDELLSAPAAPAAPAAQSRSTAGSPAPDRGPPAVPPVQVTTASQPAQEIRAAAPPALEPRPTAPKPSSPLRQYRGFGSAWDPKTFGGRR